LTNHRRFGNKVFPQADGLPRYCYGQEFMARKLKIAQGDDHWNPDPQWIARVRAKLLAWYPTVARKLPWRETRDPYRILVSETMLVQTTVAAVIDYFHRFLERFPDVAALANADESDVLKAWEGLGYYRRARQLHRAAKTIVSEYDGVIPANASSLLALPGVGRYIAGAVSSFAFDLPVPIIEANTQRVLARWLALQEDVRSTPAQKRLWKVAEQLVPEIEPGQFNQAFMELGALICSPRTPTCLMCPVQSECRARKLGQQDSIPLMQPKAAPLQVSEVVVLVRKEDRYLVLQRGPGLLWESFWEFPTFHQQGVNPAKRPTDLHDDLVKSFKEVFGISIEGISEATRLNYTVTKHKVALEAKFASYESGKVTTPADYTATKWVRLAELRTLTCSSPSRKLIDWLERAEAGD
jgi:A/G-specific adenine glycosylase